MAHMLYLSCVEALFSFSLYLSPESPLATRYGQSSREQENLKKHSNKFFFVFFGSVFIYNCSDETNRQVFYTLCVSIS